MDILVLAEKWLAQSGYSRLTQRGYLIYLGLLARRYPTKQVRDFSEQDLIVFLTEPNVAPNTVLARRNGVRAFFKWCELEGIVKQDPARRLDQRVARKPVPVKTHRWLDKAEVSRLLASCTDGAVGRRDLVMLTLFLSTGLRRHELSKLRWQQVSLDRRVITLTADSAKNGKAALVGITEQAAQVLADWAAYWTEDAGTHPRGTEPVICSNQSNPHIKGGMMSWGLPLGDRGIGLAVATRARKAGLGHLEPHDLRRSFCGLLKEKGVSLEDRQAAMRHSSPVTTQQVYDRKDPRQGLRAVEGLEL